ncbi:MAG TPA: helix-turn-helix domain-containing protein [Firmicutes bacterium]|nr:helix-turn-helix domain-containing protein [Bacillota bacterium]
MLGERIRQLRAGRGISQVELADALGVTKQSVSNWENNNIQPSIDMLLKLSAYFSVSTDSLLGLDDRTYLEVTGLSEEKLRHIQFIIEDMRR